ncbi:MAG: hypothetical protein H9872_09345 [Candidatus Cellulosilyticum pullistercoris]|uniref:Uncharacterized protein n=1 Tax=Candidatus Cellulosilyticum pullistercoris TaxID=2838521 RepID=A0A9E2KE64_9FIRM|nr:hypothetical protein [Candidatus Cellulosilyticum pullistercoris]
MAKIVILDIEVIVIVTIDDKCTKSLVKESLAINERRNEENNKQSY